MDCRCIGRGSLLGEKAHARQVVRVGTVQELPERDTQGSTDHWDVFDPTAAGATFEITDHPDTPAHGHCKIALTPSATHTLSAHVAWDD